MFIVRKMRCGAIGNFACLRRVGYCLILVLLYLIDGVVPGILEQCKEQGPDSCGLTNGCSWCSPNKVENDSSCLPWQQCGGPPDLCELRRNQSDCEIIKGHFASSLPACAWCSTEGRCVLAPIADSYASNSNNSMEVSKQCLGCDGMFDSGTVPDICNVCGGGCVSPDPSNPSCWCLGCDRKPFSGAVLDQCGICGGDNSTCVIPHNLTHNQKVGIILAICGNLFISFGLNIQKQAHNANARREVPISYTHLPLWQAGLFVMTLGETGNFLAYAYAPATLVAPLGSVSVIGNGILAYSVLFEPPRPRTLAGSAIAIVGSVLIVTFAPSSDRPLTMEVLAEYMQEPRFLVFIAFLVTALLGLLFGVDDKTKRRYVCVYALICSLSGALTVMCIKGTSTALILTFQGHNQFHSVLPWVLVVVAGGTVFIQMRYLQLAMIYFKASEVVPVYYVLFTLCSILGGMMLYQEYHQNCPPTDPDCVFFLFFLLGCVVTFVGVFLITLDAPPDETFRGTSLGCVLTFVGVFVITLDAPPGPTPARTNIQGGGGDGSGDNGESGGRNPDFNLSGTDKSGGGGGDSSDALDMDEWPGLDAPTAPLLSGFSSPDRDRDRDRVGPALAAPCSTL